MSFTHNATKDFSGFSVDFDGKEQIDTTKRTVIKGDKGKIHLDNETPGRSVTLIITKAAFGTYPEYVFTHTFINDNK